MCRSLAPPPVRAGSRRGRGSRLVRVRVLQAGLLMGFWAAGEGLVRITGLPVPGPVVGLFLALAALASGRLPVRSLRHGSDWLIAEMLLFFIPPMLSLLDYPQFLGLLGLKILAAILLGILAVMVTTALTIEAFHRMGGMGRDHGGC